MLLNMEGNKAHYRHLIRFFYRRSKNATRAKKVCAVHYEGATAKKMVWKWFARFKASDFKLDN